MVEVNGQGIEDVDRFVYLGATDSKQGGGTEDIHNRVVKARGGFLKLKKIWSGNSMSRRITKVRQYTTLVKPVLMYGCETWKMNRSDENKTDVFQSRCLRRISKIRYQERIPNKEVLKMEEMENLSEGVRKRRWQFIGHIMRKEPNNDCRIALTWIPEGRRKRDRPKTTWRKTAERERKKAGWKTGARYKSQRLLELVGGFVLRLYVAHNTKIGNRSPGVLSFAFTTH